MKKIYLKIAFTILFGFIHLNLFSQSILQDIAGQYPLKCKVVNQDVDYAKFTEIGPWDISLNGNHGRVEPLMGSDIRANESFDAIEFKGKTYLKGIGKGQIKLDKDPFAHVVPDNFTVAFWIKEGSAGRVLRISCLDIDVDVNNTINFVFTEGIKPVNLKTTFSDLDGDGWVNIAFVYNKKSKKVSIYADSVEVLDANLQNSINTNYSESFLADYDFQGGLANVSFVRLALDPTTLPLLNDIIQSQDAYASRMFRNYPLDGVIDSDYGIETVSGKNAISSSNVRSTSNRNDQTRKALRFEDTGKIVLPYLFGEKASTDHYDESRGVTVSLWIKIENQEETPLLGTNPVIVPNDVLHSILYGINDNKQPIFGLQRVKDRLGNYTYINGNDIKYPWYNWYYDPVGFRNTSGWFHIIYVQHKNWTKTYLAKAGERAKFDCAVTDWDCWRTAQIHYDYNSFQSIDDITQWGLGSFDSTHISHTVIDDLSIYRWPMDAEQVAALHNSVENITENGVNKIKTKEIIDDKNMVSKFLLHPNPSIDGSFQLEFELKKQGFTRVEIANLAGQLVFKKEYQNLDKGNHTLLFGKSDVVLSSGIYIVKVVTNVFNDSCKLIIK